MYSVNVTENEENQVLWAAEHGEIDMLKSLIKKYPCLLNHKDKDGYSPLHKAVSENHRDCVRYLIAAGADISTQSNTKWQPLHSACQWNNKEIAMILIENGADVNAESDGGNIQHFRKYAVLNKMNCFFRSNTTAYCCQSWCFI